MLTLDNTILNVMKIYNDANSKNSTIPVGITILKDGVFGIHLSFASTIVKRTINR